jgi:16S rRNA (adenine1518-N6/adenine1519-N6)-dimethyltransferase
MNIDVLQYMRQDSCNYSVIANIPYYITSPILHHFLYRLSHSPDEMVIMMQKDVADKILACEKKKKPKSSVLSLFLSKKTNIKSICDV